MKKTLHRPLPYPQTPATAAVYFRDHGICIAHWAKDLGLTRMSVMDSLRGQAKGKRGMSYRAAIALGMKKAPKAGAQ